MIERFVNARTWKARVRVLPVRQHSDLDITEYSLHPVIRHRVLEEKVLVL